MHNRNSIQICNTHKIDKALTMSDVVFKGPHYTCGLTHLICQTECHMGKSLKLCRTILKTADNYSFFFFFSLLEYGRSNLVPLSNNGTFYYFFEAGFLRS